MKALINLITVYRMQPESILDNMEIIKQLCNILMVDEQKLINQMHYIRQEEYFDGIQISNQILQKNIKKLDDFTHIQLDQVLHADFKYSISLTDKLIQKIYFQKRQIQDFISKIEKLILECQNYVNRLNNIRNQPNNSCYKLDNYYQNRQKNYILIILNEYRFIFKISSISQSLEYTADYANLEVSKIQQEEFEETAMYNQTKQEPENNQETEKTLNVTMAFNNAQYTSELKRRIGEQISKLLNNYNLSQQQQQLNIVADIKEIPFKNFDLTHLQVKLQSLKEQTIENQQIQDQLEQKIMNSDLNNNLQESMLKSNAIRRQTQSLTIQTKHVCLPLKLQNKIIIFGVKVNFIGHNQFSLNYKNIFRLIVHENYFVFTEKAKPSECSVQLNYLFGPENTKFILNKLIGNQQNQQYKDEIYIFTYLNSFFGDKAQVENMTFFDLEKYYKKLIEKVRPLENIIKLQRENPKYISYYMLQSGQQQIKMVDNQKEIIFNNILNQLLQCYMIVDGKKYIYEGYEKIEQILKQ